MQFRQVNIPKGENLEQHLNRRGLSHPCRYPIFTFAILSDDGWQEYEAIEQSYGTPEAISWHDKIEAYIDSLPDNNFLVVIDYHI